ncbi:hypothetical protein B6U99_06975 [Candidatus Geothermarchaeota archaeon ex4572_27]|nr:MAG: hypothetical protein B6U99_06975 [Candidatus Geothermarchaeota archaeon ex4572_27]
MGLSPSFSPMRAQRGLWRRAVDVAKWVGAAIDEELYEKIGQLARALRLSKSDIIKMALAHLLATFSYLDDELKKPHIALRCISHGGGRA